LASYEEKFAMTSSRKPARAVLGADVVWAARTWYLKKWAETRSTRYGPRPSSPGPAPIGLSQAATKLIGSLPEASVPSTPPAANLAPADAPLSEALYPYAREVQLANQGIGYGEAVVDVVLTLKSHQLQQSAQLNRRTKSGRQQVVPGDDGFLASVGPEVPGGAPGSVGGSGARDAISSAGVAAPDDHAQDRQPSASMVQAVLRAPAELADTQSELAAIRAAPATRAGRPQPKAPRKRGKPSGKR
jgi:hypothetical protein